MLLAALTLLLVAIVLVAALWFSRRSKGKAASTELREAGSEMREARSESGAPELLRTFGPLIRYPIVPSLP